MNKKVAYIVIIGMIVLLAGGAALFILRPMMETQKAASPAYNDAWKLERIQGSWASENERYALSIDAYDYTLKVDGIYAMVACLQFDDSEKLQEGTVHFTLQIDPSSVIYPDAEGALHCEIDALWYEDGMIYMRLNDVESMENDPVCLLHTAASLPPAWPHN